MKKEKKGELELCQFENLSRGSGIKHFVCSRNSGFSKVPFDSMNMSIHIGDEDEAVVKNRKLLAEEMEVIADDLIFCRQTHSNNVAVYKKGDKGVRKIKGFNEFSDADAIITDEEGKCILVIVADCVPILLFDPIEKVIGSVHAGWPGATKKITEHAVLKMIKEYGSNPKNILAGIGPSIKAGCYSIDEKRAKIVEKELKEDSREVLKEKNGKIQFDLWKANQLQLLRSGLKEENIEVAGICTHCNLDDWFSYRGEKEELERSGKRAHAGRFAVGIVLRKLKVKSSK